MNTQHMRGRPHPLGVNSWQPACHWFHRGVSHAAGLEVTGSMRMTGPAGTLPAADHCGSFGTFGPFAVRSSSRFEELRLSGENSGPERKHRCIAGLALTFREGSGRAGTYVPHTRERHGSERRFPRCPLGFSRVSSAAQGLQPFPAGRQTSPEFDIVRRQTDTSKHQEWANSAGFARLPSRKRGGVVGRFAAVGLKARRLEKQIRFELKPA